MNVKAKMDYSQEMSNKTTKELFDLTQQKIIELKIINTILNQRYEEEKVK